MLIVESPKSNCNRHRLSDNAYYLCSKQKRRVDMFELKDLVVKCMREVADKIEVGTSEISESEAIDILRIVAHESLSKEQACNYLNLSRARFDDLVREKKIPRGKKRVGFKELVFYKDELDVAVRKIKDGKKK